MSVRIPFWQPKGKSSATKTARTLRAWAADLENAALGLRFAAVMYERGETEQGRFGAHASFSGFGVGVVVRSYRDKKGPQDAKRSPVPELNVSARFSRCAEVRHGPHARTRAP